MIEHFPVGRRLAYDAAAGRLWVVCTQCGRWNLSPLESRWEAIEDAERLYGATRKRVSSDNIGLCRLTDGTDLVRVGQPLRPEFAAWRYGGQFIRRHRRWMLRPMVWPAVLSAPVFCMQIESMVTSGVLITPALGTAIAFGTVAAGAYQLRDVLRRSLRIRGGGNDILNMSIAETYEATISPAGHAFEWQLNVPTAQVEPARGIRRLLGIKDQVKAQQVEHLRNDDARRVLAQILPHINGLGGGKAEVARAVEIVEDAPNANYLLHKASVTKTHQLAIEVDDIADRRHEKRFRWNIERAKRRRLLVAEPAKEVIIGRLPLDLRLALEMSLHEDDERRAMQGELRELEARWREAEVIAMIADSMFDSSAASARLAELRHGAAESGSLRSTDIHRGTG